LTLGNERTGLSVCLVEVERQECETERRDSWRSQTLSVDSRGEAMEHTTDTDKDVTEVQVCLLFQSQGSAACSQASSVDSTEEAMKDKKTGIIEEENTEAQVEVNK
ncbi:unnamed protein product, partial [Ectocarpus fasciculatus]